MLTNIERLNITVYLFISKVAHISSKKSDNSSIVGNISHIALSSVNALEYFSIIDKSL